MPVISFKVNDEQYADAAAYAQAKGFQRPGPMARVAMFQMMARYPIHKAKAGQGDGKHPADPLAVQPDALMGAFVETGGPG